MMGASNLMMGLTLVLVVCLAVVLGFVLVLLAELHCSILVRRRQLQQTTTTVTAPLTIVDNNNNSSSPPPPSFVGDDIEKQQQLPQQPKNQENNQEGLQWSLKFKPTTTNLGFFPCISG
ncbi:unnamed protein product [Lactuca virosa]|uniref:Transmembrane protein n=1 Tax=Lactuca virosa TaxID=75947 RepID=A0AAU9MS71_9ASTR|nr:unnamed protein product [Lactuca virosa]